MTDENTRLPSDSVVEAWTWQESWPCTAGGNNKLLTKVALEKPDPAMLYVLPETIRPLAALAAQPRDDVREGRFITVWRKTGEQCLDWDFHVSENVTELREVESNLSKQDVRQRTTYHLGAQVEAIGDLDTALAPTTQGTQDADDTPHAYDEAAPDTCRKCGNEKTHAVHIEQPDTQSKWGFRAITPKDEAHAAVLEDLARRIDDE